MDHDHHFPVEQLSETDRSAALTRLINEYNALKSVFGDEINHRKRQKLLSIWGDLVLGRTDPDAPQLSQQDLTPLDTQNDEAAAIAITPDDGAAGDGGDADAQVSEFVNASLHEETEALHNNHQDPAVHGVTEEPVYEDYEMQMHQEAAPDLEATKDHHLSQMMIDDIAAHQDIDTVETPHEREPVLQHAVISINEGETSDHTLLATMLSPADDQKEAALVIHQPSDDQKNHADLVAISEPHDQTITTSLAKIYDVQEPEPQPLIEIKSVRDVEKPLSALADLATGQIHESVPDMVRLRLLKSGVLHDMILPEGTIVSTFAADAEELIASGTAEKLLIQAEKDDD